MASAYVKHFFLLVVAAASALTISLYEREIFSHPSEFNGTVRVTENFRGIRFLKFGTGDAVQSFYDTRSPDAVLSPYVRVTLSAFDRVGGPVRRVLVIGMGGGVQGTAARRRFPDAVIDLVEVCPVVASAAVDLLGLVPDDLMRVHVIDGLQFIESSKSRYDVVFIDAFNGTEPPQHLITELFFTAVRQRLAPGGVVAANVVYRDTSPVYDLILHRMVLAFGLIDIVDVPGGRQNRVIFSSAAVRPER